MNTIEKRKKIIEFIQQQKLIVVATAHKDGKPEAAVVEFVVNSNFEIIFDALPNFRKCKNIKENPLVAIVAGGEDDRTVQYEGKAHEITDKTEIEKYRQIAEEKYPNSAEIINTKGLIWYKVKPNWIRCLDVGVHPWQQFEINFK